MLTVLGMVGVTGLLTSCKSSSGGFSLHDVTFLNANVAGWKETATVAVSLSRSSLTLDSDKKAVWPDKDNVNACAWVIFNANDTWHAATFDYMRPGQTTKPIGGLEIKGPGVKWRPASGEKVGFMISGLARDHRRNVEERSPVYFEV